MKKSKKNFWGSMVFVLLTLIIVTSWIVHIKTKKIVNSVNDEILTNNTVASIYPSEVDTYESGADREGDSDRKEERDREGLVNMKKTEIETDPVKDVSNSNSLNENMKESAVLEEMEFIYETNPMKETNLIEEANSMEKAGSGYANSTTGNTNSNESNRYGVKVKSNDNEEYVTITDEKIINNLLFLINEVTSAEEIEVSNNGSIPYMNDLQINVTGLEDEYLIRFSIYYADEYSDGGKRVVVVEYGGNTSYYYMVNDLYDFISNTLTD